VNSNSKEITNQKGKAHIENSKIRLIEYNKKMKMSFERDRANSTGTQNINKKNNKETIN